MKKIAILFTLIMATTTTLFGCGAKAQPDVSADKSVSSEANDDKADKYNSSETSSKSTTYTAEAGYTITFPASWEGKYIIEEDENGLTVFYKLSKDKTTESKPYLFAIKKAETILDLNIFDTVGNIRSFNIGEQQYYVGGATGLTLGEDSADFQDYLEINKQRGEVVDTIKVIK